MKWHSIVKWVGGVLSAFLAGWLCETFKDHSFLGMIWNFILWVGSLLRIKLELWIFLLFLIGLVSIIFIVLHFSEYRANQEKVKERERRRALIEEVQNGYKEEYLDGILWTFSGYYALEQWYLNDLQACCPKCHTPLYDSQCPRCNTSFYGKLSLLNPDKASIIIRDNFKKRLDAIKAKSSV